MFLINKSASFKCLPHVLTAQGNAQISTAQHAFGGSSGLFDGANDSIKVTPKDFDFGTDFTLEMWLRLVDPGTSNIGCIMGQFQVNDLADKSWRFLHGNFDGDSTPKLVWTWSTNGSNENDIKIASGMSINTWYHIAVSRSGSNLRIFRDGTVLTTGTMSTNPYTGGDSDLLIGEDISYSYDGYMDELRVSDTARYTSSFTKPLAAFTPDANTNMLMHFNGTNGSTNFIDSRCA